MLFVWSVNTLHLNVHFHQSVWGLSIYFQLRLCQQQLNDLIYINTCHNCFQISSVVSNAKLLSDLFYVRNMLLIFLVLWPFWYSRFFLQYEDPVIQQPQYAIQPTYQPSAESQASLSVSYHDNQSADQSYALQVSQASLLSLEAVSLVSDVQLPDSKESDVFNSSLVATLSKQTQNEGYPSSEHAMMNNAGSSSSGIQSSELVSPGKHKSLTIYTCQDCGRVYPKKYSMEYHRFTSHGMEGKYKCSACPRTFMERIRYKRHMKNVHNVQH